MAAPIKVTPVLSGESSKHFNESLKTNNGKVPASERNRIISLVEKVLSNKK